MPTTSVSDFRDFLPALRICKTFFQATLGFCPAQEVQLYCMSITWSCEVNLGNIGQNVKLIYLEIGDNLRIKLFPRIFVKTGWSRTALG